MAGDPLASIRDPLRGIRDPFPDLGPGGGSGSAPAYRRPLPPEESAGLRSQLATTGMSALSWLGSSLDKPGRAVRGALAGRFGELGALVPFSDSMGLTDPENAVSGRNLTDRWGLTSRGDKGWGAWGAGLGAEMLLDPTMYVGAGALKTLTPAGKALSKAGMLKGWSRRAMLEGFHATEPALRAAGETAEQVAYRINQGQRIASQEAVDAVARTGGTLQPGRPLSALFGLKPSPFHDPRVFLGQGDWSKRIAGGLDALGDRLKYGNALGRTLNGLFDYKVNGATGAMTQRAWAKYGTEAAEGALRAGKQDVYNLVDKLDPLIKDGVLPERQVLDSVRQSAEGLPVRQLGPVAPDIAASIGEAGDLLHRPQARMLDEAQNIGLPLRDSSDQFVRYTHRQPVNAAARKLQARGENLYPVATGSNVQREALYRDIPGGQTRLDDWAQRFAGQKATTGTARAIKKEMVLDYQLSGGKMSKALGQQFDDKAKALAERMELLDPSHAADKVPLYTPNVVSDLARRGEQHARTMGAAHAVFGALGDNARPLSQLGGDHVTVPEVLKALGYKTIKADQQAGTPMRGALVEAYRRLAKAGAGPVEPLLMGKLKDIRKAAAKYGITRDQFEELAKAHSKWSMPEVAKAPIGALDSITNAFKNLTYPIWVPSHVRNLMGGGINNAIEGVGASSYAKQARLMRGTATAADLAKLGVPAGLADEEARRWVRGRQFASAGVFSGHNGVTDIAGAVAAKLKGAGGRITPNLPGADRVGKSGSLAGDIADLALREGLLAQAKETGAKLASFRPFGYGRGVGRLNPRNWFDPAKPWGLGMAGVGGRTADTMPLLKAGRMAGSNIEDLLRGAQWINEVEKGASHAVAGEAVNRAHFDYDKLSGFEKRWMRRLVPFYTYARKNLPFQLERLATNPGVASAQARLMTAGRADDGFVPPYLAQGAAVPLGPEVDGQRRFVSQFGTPLEEALERFKFRGGAPDLRATALAHLATLNPVLKAPLEQLFNTQFHTGRKLSDLQAPRSVSAMTKLVGEDNPQLLSQLLVNTPATRFLTSLDKAIDERKPWWAKALNLATGVKVTDADLDRARVVEAREALGRRLESSPHVASYTSYYVRPGQADRLSPAEVENLRMLSTMERAARDYAEKRRRAEQAEQRRIGIAPR